MVKSFSKIKKEEDFFVVEGRLGKPLLGEAPGICFSLVRPHFMAQPALTLTGSQQFM